MAPPVLGAGRQPLANRVQAQSALDPAAQARVVRPQRVAPQQLDVEVPHRAHPPALRRALQPGPYLAHAQAGVHPSPHAAAVPGHWVTSEGGEVEGAHHRGLLSLRGAADGCPQLRLGGAGARPGAQALRVRVAAQQLPIESGHQLGAVCGGGNPGTRPDAAVSGALVEAPGAGEGVAIGSDDKDEAAGILRLLVGGRPGPAAGEHIACDRALDLPGLGAVGPDHAAPALAQGHREAPPARDSVPLPRPGAG